MAEVCGDNPGFTRPHLDRALAATVVTDGVSFGCRMGRWTDGITYPRELRAIIGAIGHLGRHRAKRRERSATGVSTMVHPQIRPDPDGASRPAPPKSHFTFLNNACALGEHVNGAAIGIEWSLRPSDGAGREWKGKGWRWTWTGLREGFP